MSRLTRMLLMALLIFPVMAESVSATTYYIAASGSDSNSGTSKSSPWLHAPGMPQCTATCAATTPVAGDSFIFRGGDTWHFENRSPSSGVYAGVPWTLSWSGKSTTTTVAGCRGSGCIYFGTDQTWYSGASFTRPILDADNPLSAASVSSCPYDETNQGYFVHLDGSYLRVDDFEVKGICDLGSPSSGIGPTAFLFDPTNARWDTVSNSYIHGWSEDSAAGSGHDNVHGFNGTTSHVATHNEVGPGDVMDGSDSPADSGWVLYSDAYDVHGDVFRYVANGLNSPGNCYWIHDNLFDHIIESYDTAVHSGTIECGLGISGVAQIVNNNTFVDIHTGAGILWLEPQSANAYVFNNVNYGLDTANCVIMDGQGSGGPAVTFYYFNNTFDQSAGPCHFELYGQHAGQEFNGTAEFQNNHLIAYSSTDCSGSCPTQFATLESTDGTVYGTGYVDNGNEVFQSETTANGQGYTATDGYAPTASSNSTVSAGADLTRDCATFSPDSALCSGTSGGVTEASGQGGYVAVSPSVTPNPRSSTWDAGAYQYGAGSTSTQPNAPTGLSVTAQ